MKKLLYTAVIALIFVPATLAATPGKFLRFEMTETESGASPTEVNVRIPLSLLNVFSDQIDEAISEVELENEGLDLRIIWEEIRAAGPNEYVEINQEGTHLKISTTETHVQIEATEDDREITASFPLALGDLIFQYGDQETTDLIAALSEFTDQDLFTIDGDGIQARAWIETAE